MSSFLLIKCPFLAQICIRKALLPHMSSILILNELYSPHSLSKNACYPNTSSFLLYTCPSLTPFPARKVLLPPPPPPSELFYADYMSFTGPILHQKSFVEPKEHFSADSVLLLVEFSIKNLCVLSLSSFLLIPCTILT